MPTDLDMAVNLLLLAVGLFVVFVTTIAAFTVAAVIYAAHRWSMRAWQVVRDFREWKDTSEFSGTQAGETRVGSDDVGSHRDRHLGGELPAG